MIPFNLPYFSGKETEYIRQAVESQKISGDGRFTKLCNQFFEEKLGFSKVLLTTSCTDALEMAAILMDIQPRDEVIMPAYTFVSTANAFVLRGARIVFADSSSAHPNIDAALIESLITNKTKAIVPVHYAGHACDMDAIDALAKKYNLKVVEDAAQAIDATYKEKTLGTIGDMAAFSFHETKNIISGEGGMLAINNPAYQNRAEIIREKGTNRSQFFRGEVDKYGWVDIGSSFLPSDIIAAYLFAQLEKIEDIQQKRKNIWQQYYNELLPLQQKEKCLLPQIPNYASNNGHMFYLVCKSLVERTALITYLKENGVSAVFHYLSLHKSPFYEKHHDGRLLPNCDKFADTLVRLPLFYELSSKDQEKVISCIHEFYR